MQKAREDAQRPGPEKAARIQDLHKKLRVSGLIIEPHIHVPHYMNMNMYVWLNNVFIQRRY